MQSETNGPPESKDGAQGKKARNRMPREVRVYPSWCKRCGICSALCPTGALEKGPDGAPVWKNPEKCVGCRICQLRCPDFAIEVIAQEENQDASR